MKKVLIAIVLLLLIAGGGFFGLDYYARQEAVRRVDATLQSLPSDIETSRGEVRYAFLTDTLQIDDLTLKVTHDGEESLRIARLTLSNLGELSDGRISIGELVASRIETSVENWQLDQEATLSGTGSIGSYEGKGVIVAPDYADTWTQALQALSVAGGGDMSPQLVDSVSRDFAFDSFVVRDYQADLQIVLQIAGSAPTPVDYSISIPEAKLDSYKDGRLASATFASFDLDAKSDALLGDGIRGFQFSITSDAGSLKGLDSANLWRLYSAEDSNEGPIPLLGEVEIADLSYHINTAAPFNDLRLSFDSFAMADYRLSPGYIEQLNLLQQNSDPLRIMHNLKGLIETYYLGRMDFSGMSFRSADAVQPQVDIGRLSIEKFEGAGFDKVLFEGFKLAAPGKGNIAVAAFELGGFDYSGMIEHLPTIAASEVFPRGSLPKMDLFRLSGLDVDLPEVSFALGNLLLVSDDYYQSVATEGHMEMANLVFDLKGLNAQGQIASAVTGLDVLDISMNMDHSWDVPSGDMDLKNITLTLNGLGKISLDLSIGGAGDSIVALMHGDDTAFNGEEAQKLALRSARIVYEDQSLLPKLYQGLAAFQGLTSDQVRAGFVAQAASYAQILKDPILVKSFDRGIRSFAADPRSLEIRLDPSEPVPLVLLPIMAQSTPGELARALGPSIAVNQ